MEREMTNQEFLAVEIATFERQKDELLNSGNEGKYVVIQGDRVLGIWDTYQDALQAGYGTVGLDRSFLVKQLSGLERVHFINRDVLKCQS